jgi:signal transduction histidine kinase
VTALRNLLGPIGRSAAFRLALIYVALFTAAAALAAIAVIWQTNAELSRQMLRGLRGERDELAQVARARGAEALAAVVEERSRSAGGGLLYHLTDNRGVRVAGNLTQRPASLAADRAGGLFSYPSAGRERIAAGLTTALPGGGLLVVARDVEDQRALTDALRRLFLWSLLGLAAAGLLGGILASRVLLKRVEAISDTSRRIMAGDLSQRIVPAGRGDELDDLAASLNAMLERIEQLMAGLREVSDNIAHDLKTPLNRLRARAEAALRDSGEAKAREGLERVIEDADDIIRTFNALLLIARLEAGAVAETFATFDLAAAVRDVAELYEPVAEDQRLAIEVTAEMAPVVTANRELIGQAVANLIDNALKYGARAEQTEPIRVRVDRAGDGIEVSVADRGPGISAADRARVLRRFVRLEASRTKPGTGLGLSLVAAVARLHGGSVRLEDNAPGLRVVLVLPGRLVVSMEGRAAPPPRVETRERAHAGSE